MNKAMRLKQLEELLTSRPRRVVDLADELGVGRRSIERDLAELRGSGLPIEQDGPEYFIRTKGPALNPVEALAVHSATRLLVHHAEINERHYRSALEKLARQLPEPARSSAHQSVDDLARKDSANSRILDQVAQAWFEGRFLRFNYQSVGSRSGQAYPQELAVYFFEISRTNLAAYVVGFERRFHNAIRVFKLDRMQDAMLTDETYQVPADFDPHDYLSAAWGIVVGNPVQVRLRFRPHVNRQVRELPLRNLEITDESADGHLEVTAVAGATSRDRLPHELLAWIRSWGPAVEVVEPAYIREFMKIGLQEALELY